MHRLSRLIGLTFISAAALASSGCGGGGVGYGGSTGGGSAPIITNITISNPSPSGTIVGGMLQLTVVAKDSNGNAVANPTLAWKSSDPEVATVDDKGLVTGVSVNGTGGSNKTTITASATYTSAGVYTTGPGITYVSNQLVIEVSQSTFAAGVVARGHAIPQALVVLEDAQGRTETTLSDEAGRFMLSTVGLKAPFLLEADDGHGHVLFGAAAAAGGANIDTVTDLMLRAWYAARGATPEDAFDAPGTHALLDTQSLHALEHSFKGVLRDALTAEGLDANSFDLFSTPFAADNTGFDAVLDNTHVLIGRHLGLEDGITGRTTDVGFNKGELTLRVR